MKLCVALDLPSCEENLLLVEKLSKFSIWYKIGLRAFIRDGFYHIEELKKINQNAKIFLDLKIHDIPNTMADAMEEAAALGVDMINLHASSGKIAMKTVMERLNKRKKRPFVLAVSALTSFDEEGFMEVYEKSINEKIIQFSKDAYECGLDGMVCSVYESRSIKSITSPSFLTLTPGIRPFNEESNDQKRVGNLQTAKNEKSDFIVIGRPIYKSHNPEEIVYKILKNI